MNLPSSLAIHILNSSGLRLLKLGMANISASLCAYYRVKECIAPFWLLLTIDPHRTEAPDKANSKYLETLLRLKRIALKCVYPRSHGNMLFAKSKG